MKNILLAATLTMISSYALAKDYQVTGSVTEVSDSKIIIDKKGEKFEIGRSADSKINGEAPVVGGSATVYYTMTATKIESKAKAEGKKKKTK